MQIKKYHDPSYQSNQQYLLYKKTPPQNLSTRGLSRPRKSPGKPAARNRNYFAIHYTSWRRPRPPRALQAAHLTSIGFPRRPSPCLYTVRLSQSPHEDTEYYSNFKMIFIRRGIGILNHGKVMYFPLLVPVPGAGY